MNGPLVSRRRLFGISFAAITATSFCFVLRAMVVDEWGVAFGLSETQKGELLGVGLWPFAISIVLLSLVIDRIGFRRAFGFAAACHIVGLAYWCRGRLWSLMSAPSSWRGEWCGRSCRQPARRDAYNEDKPAGSTLHAAAARVDARGVIAIAFGAHSTAREDAIMAVPVLI